nr:hypothetical protein [Tanacetum cinerariifolium]
MAVKRKFVKKEAPVKDSKTCKKQRVAVKSVKKIFIEHDDDDDEKSQCSSVGSNDPLSDVIYFAVDLDEDEAQSSFNGYNDVTCNDLSKAIIPQLPKLVERSRFDQETENQRRRRKWFWLRFLCGTHI